MRKNSLYESASFQAEVGGGSAPSASGEAEAKAGEGGAAPSSAPSADAGASGGAGLVGTEAGESVEAPAEGAGDPPAPKAPKADWRDARIAKYAAKMAEAAAKIEKLEAAAAKPGETQAPDVEAIIEQRANEKAKALAAAREFTARCEEVNTLGTTKFKDWDKKLNGLVELVDRKDPASVRAYSDLVAAAIEIGNAHEILHSLGGDLGEAERIMGLPPVKQAVELTRLAARGGSVVSNAPKPPTPVGNRGASHDQIDPRDPEAAGRLSTAEWMKRREAQVAQERKRA